MTSPGLDKGIIQVYTGDGKGKSTAAFGLAVRAAGHGLHSCIVQFMKAGTYGENKMFAGLQPQIQCFAFGREGYVYKGKSAPEDRARAKEGLDFAREIMFNGKIDILILDELNVALYFDLLPLEDVLDFLNQKPDRVELVLTGRAAPPEIIEKAQLVTEMRMIKHPYQEGILSRKGIEF